MLTVLSIVACCALVPLALGIVAVLGLSKKNKNPTGQEETSRRYATGGNHETTAVATAPLFSHSYGNPTPSSLRR